MAFTTDMFNTNGNPAELNTRSFAGQILRRFPNGSAPIYAMTSQSGKAKAKASTHGYFSKTMSFVRLTSSAALVGDTTITFSSAAGLLKGMVLHNLRTGENVRVTADTTHATQAAVARAFGRVAAAAVNNTDVWILVGTAMPEGSLRPTARRMTTVYISNYTQIFRNAWAVTDTARASYAEAGYSNVQEDRNDCAILHATEMESAVIWGQAKMDTSGAQPLHSTQGIIDALKQYAPTNINAAGATTSYSQLVTLVEPAFTYSTNMGNPTERIAFCDNTAMKVLNDIGRKSGQVTMTNDTTSFGLRFVRFQFYNGSINLVTHPLMNGLGTSGLALIMDMAALKLAYMDGRDTKNEEYGANGKIVESGTDGVGGSLTTEFAVEFINPAACACITGLTAGVADA
jgi:hypothetical protein